MNLEIDLYDSRTMTRGLYTHPNISDSSINAFEPPYAQSLDQLWDIIRQEEAKKMEETPKVQPFEQVAQELLDAEQAPVHIPLMEYLPVSTPSLPVSAPSLPVSAPKSVKKHRSM